MILTVSPQPVVLFAGEHCHPSFYSTGHGAYLTGRSAAQVAIRSAKESSAATSLGLEPVYNLEEASVTDLSAWLAELSCGAGGEKSLEDYRVAQTGSRPRRDDGRLVTPR